jgi:hypothetical protein
MVPSKFSYTQGLSGANGIKLHRGLVGSKELRYTQVLSGTN